MTRAKMDFNKKKYILDIFLSIAFLISAISGLVLLFILTRGSGNVIFIFPRYNWVKMHNMSSLALVVFVVIHLIFNWRWVKVMTKNTFFRKNA